MTTPTDFITPLPSFHKIPTFHGMVASGALAVITAVAFGALFSMNGQIGASFLQMGSIAGIAGVSFSAFVLMTVLTIRTHSRQKEARAQEEEQIEEEDAARRAREVAARTAALQAQLAAEAAAAQEGERPPVTITHLQVAIPALLQAGQGAVTELVKAHGRTVGQASQHEWKIRAAFQNGEDLLQRNLETKFLYLEELLCLFGKSKLKPSIALRRLIAAHNCASEKYQNVKADYDAIMRGNNLDPIVDLLLTPHNTNADILRLLPEKLKDRFPLADPDLQGMGRDLLDIMFSNRNLDTNQRVTRALQELKDKAESEGMYYFTKEIEKFLRIAFKEANLQEDRIDSLCDRLVVHMLNTQFKANIQRILGIIARHIELLPHMFEQHSDTSTLFPLIDRTFLLSESNDCITQEKRDLQEELIMLQSTFNHGLAEEKRVAFIVDRQDEQTQYLIDSCTEANFFHHNQAILTQIEENVEVRALAGRYNVSIRAVPISISDHPFKEIRKYLNTIPKMIMNAIAENRLLRNAIKGIVIGKMSSAIDQNLPSLIGEDRRILDEALNTMLDALLKPILDGAVSNSSQFRGHFERVITTSGAQIARELGDLAGREDLSVHDIITQAQAALEGLEEAFRGVT